MKSLDQLNYNYILTKDFKDVRKGLTKEQKEKINELLICWENVREFVNKILTT